MYRSVVVALLLACQFTCTPSATQASPAPTRADNSLATPLNQLEWVLGGKWVADASKLPGGLNRIEVSYDTAPGNPQVIRFETHFVDATGAIPNTYVGVMYFDTARKSMRIWYIDSQGQITEGPMNVSGNEWSVRFKSDGSIIGRSGLVDFVVRVVHDGEAYHWGLSADLGGTTHPVFALDYRHMRPAV